MATPWAISCDGGEYQLKDPRKENSKFQIPNSSGCFLRANCTGPSGPFFFFPVSKVSELYSPSSRHDEVTWSCHLFISSTCFHTPTTSVMRSIYRNYFFLAENSVFPHKEGCLSRQNIPMGIFSRMHGSTCGRLPALLMPTSEEQNLANKLRQKIQSRANFPTTSLCPIKRRTPHTLTRR